MSNVEITKEQFLAVESVRESGVTNMFDVKMVESLSGVPKDVIKIIYSNYDELKKRYLVIGDK